MGVDAVKQRLRAASWHGPQYFDTETFDLSAGTPGERSLVASYKAKRAHTLKQGGIMDLAPVAYETFTTDGSGTQQTFNLSNDLVESGATDVDLVLYANGSRVSPDAVNYSGDSFDYTDGGAAEDLAVYYAAGDQAVITIRKESPSGVHEELWTGDVGLIHRRDNAQDPITLGLNLSVWQRYIPTNWSLEVYINAPYTVAWAKDSNNDGSEDPATNALLSVPHFRSSSSIEGLDAVVRADAAQR